MAVTIQLRRGLSTQWTISNPVLAQGEMAVETDTQGFKIGDGINPWNNLPYSNVNQLEDLNNIIAISPDDGAVLVYDISINKWVATTNLEKQAIDGGHF